MNLNNENIDELMFQLLEGEIQGEERTRLLDAINADKIYSRQWEAWQQTILNPNEELLVMNISKLLKKDKKPVVLWLKYCAAASLFLAIGAGVYYINTQKPENLVNIEKPVNPKLQIIKVPSIEPVNPTIKNNDSIVSFKQKVKMMVGKETIIQNKGMEQNKKVEESKEQPVIVKHEELKLVPEIRNEEPLIKKTEPTLVINKQSPDDYIITTVYYDSKPKK